MSAKRRLRRSQLREPIHSDQDWDELTPKERQAGLAALCILAEGYCNDPKQTARDIGGIWRSAIIKLGGDPDNWRERSDERTH